MRSDIGTVQSTLDDQKSLQARWRDLDNAEDRLEFFRQLPREEATELFLNLDSRAQARLLLSLPAGEHRLWLRSLAPDDAADLIQQVPDSEHAELMAQLDDSTRKEVQALLAYQEDDAGGLMSPRFARARPDMTADEAITYLRLQAPRLETIYYIYVLDEQQRVLGVLSFRDLFSADRNKLLRDIMRRQFVYVAQDTDQEHVAALFREHHLLAVPVVDEQRRMQGIITVDDIVSVLQEEVSEDIQRIGGTEELGGPYLEIGFWEMVRKRAGWLTVLFVGEMLTATAMGFFEKEIAKAVVLALFLPLIISSGGNSGSQATTLVIRAIALGELRLRDWLRVIRREFFMGIVLGLILAVIGFARILIWQNLKGTYGQHYLLIAFTISGSLIGVVTFGTIAGSMLPLLLRRLGLDPATASAPFVATLVDVTGLIIYFTLAAWILRGTLL